MKRIVRRTARRALSLVALILSGCIGDHPMGTEVRQRYRYDAVQRAPSAARIEGVLLVTRVDGERIEGTFDALDTDATGHVERRTGIVRGRMSAGSVDFDVVQDGDRFRHVGEGVADTIAGNWIDTGGTTIAGGGTFRMERIR